MFACGGGEGGGDAAAIGGARGEGGNRRILGVALTLLSRRRQGGGGERGERMDIEAVGFRHLEHDGYVGRLEHRRGAVAAAALVNGCCR